MTYWTRELILDEAKKYLYSTDFVRNSHSAYRAAYRMNIQHEVLALFDRKRKWDKESILQEANKYSSRSEFLKRSGGAAQAAKRMGIYEEATQHYPCTSKTFTLSEIADAAASCATLAEFRTKHPHAYKASLKIPGAKQKTSHLKRKQKTGRKLGSSKWSIESIQKLALKCESRMEFKSRYGSAYSKASRLHCLDEVCAHMPKIQMSWTKRMVIQAAEPYSYRLEFQKGDPKAYGAARRNGWLDEACKHMEGLKPRSSKKSPH